MAIALASSDITVTVKKAEAQKANQFKPTNKTANISNSSSQTNSEPNSTCNAVIEILQSTHCQHDSTNSRKVTEFPYPAKWGDEVGLVHLVSFLPYKTKVISGETMVDG